MYTVPNPSASAATTAFCEANAASIAASMNASKYGSASISVPARSPTRRARDKSATQARNTGAAAICAWFPASTANRSRRPWSSTATTLQVCRLLDVAADCAAATRASTVPGASASPVYARTDRCRNSPSITALPANRSGTASRYRAASPETGGA